jgi:N-acyl-D-aspartate/D-glutamate deacylase
MRQMLTDALDAGFVGLSTLRSSFSKLEGARFPARQLPSTYATWSEFAALNNVLRKRGRVHQSTPNLARQSEVGRYLAQSIGRGFRRPLKTTLIAAADVEADRKAARMTVLAAALTNRAGGNCRWQHLPVPFEMYADGVDLVVFEEFSSGSAALNFRDEMSRGRLLAVANDRDDVLDRLQRSPNVQIGFSGSGAHLRNMAFYNSGLRMLERVHRRRSMPVEKLCTGSPANWPIGTDSTPATSREANGPTSRSSTPQDSTGRVPPMPKRSTRVPQASAGWSTTMTVLSPRLSSVVKSSMLQANSRQDSAPICTPENSCGRSIAD